MLNMIKSMETTKKNGQGVFCVCVCINAAYWFYELKINVDDDERFENVIFRAFVSIVYEKYMC